MTALALALKYWREIALGLLVLVIVGIGLYIRSVFAERDRLIQQQVALKQESAALALQLKDAQADLQLQNKITEAIGKIKIRSSVNVNRIESEPPPTFVDSRPLPFIAGGVLQAVYSSATGAAAAGAASPPAPGGPVPAGKSGGALLPQ
jgi:hypothetical protein